MEKSVHKIDLNCDTGEGVGNEDSLMPYVTSCNIACGGHAGTADSVKEMLQLAKKHSVKIGAHPSFPDTENFGRKFVEMPAQELTQSLLEQIQLVETSCKKLQLPLHHIKVHGALYNSSAKDPQLADLVINLVKENFPQCILYVPYQSVIARRAEGKLKLHYEGFADRNYEDDHSLVSRKKEHALLTNKEAILNHCLQMVQDKRITTATGSKIETKVDTLCVHGDTPHALAVVKYLHEQLTNKGLLNT